MKISTKGGDFGKTKLVFLRETSKASPRVCAYGAVDEFSATLGFARSFATGELNTKILHIQERLVLLMTELATAKDDFPKLAEKKIKTLGEADLSEIESQIEEYEKIGNIFSGWTHSGENTLQAALDMARARCRTAEREIVKLAESEGLARNFPLQYVNRLADLLYLMSQAAAQTE